jgi:hypothetical protein
MRLGRLGCSSGGIREPLRLEGPEPGASEPFRASPAGDFSRLTSIFGASGALISGALISGTFTPGFLDLSAYSKKKKKKKKITEKSTVIDLYVKSHSFTHKSWSKSKKEHTGIWQKTVICPWTRQFRWVLNDLLTCNVPFWHRNDVPLLQTEPNAWQFWWNNKQLMFHKREYDVSALSTTNHIWIKEVKYSTCGII